MALKGILLGLVLVLVTTFCHEAAAQSGCTGVMMGLAPCLSYITGNSSTPPSSCCSQLSNVVQSQPQCLCSALNGGGSTLGITINQTRALALPGACNVQTPPVSQCNAANVPAKAPTSPPADSSDDTPDTSTTPSVSTIPSSGTGSKTVPTTKGNTSDGSTIRMPLHLTASVLFLILCFSRAIKI